MSEQTHILEERPRRLDSLTICVVESGRLDAIEIGERAVQSVSGCIEWIYAKRLADLRRRETALFAEDCGTGSDR